MELLHDPATLTARPKAAPRRMLAPVPPRLPQPDGDVVVVKRIELLLELGTALVDLLEAAADDEHKPGRLPGSFYVTRFPILLRRTEMYVNALRALGAKPPGTVEQLIAEPALFVQRGSHLVACALDEINRIIRGPDPHVRAARAG
jgi:hypothetical protein